MTTPQIDIEIRVNNGYNRAALAQEMSKIRVSAVIAGRSAIIIAAATLAMALISVVVDGVFDKRWNADWVSILFLTGGFGVGWLIIFFTYNYFKLRDNDAVEAILSQAPSSADQCRGHLSGFVAMEYYAPILNRTYVVFVAPDGLYG